MSSLDKHWEKYSSGVTTTNMKGDFYHVGDSSTCTDGYTCSICGAWVPFGGYHYCHNYPTVWGYHSTPNHTEQAFKILKKLVEEKVIKEPASFKKFCDLIEKIAKVI